MRIDWRSWEGSELASQRVSEVGGVSYRGESAVGENRTDRLLRIADHLLEVLYDCIGRMEAKPKYVEIRARRRDDLEADFASEDPSLICDALFSAAQHDPDWLWAQGQCLKMLKHCSPLVRSCALIALGELATFQGHLELETVLPEIDRLLTDPELGPFAADAMGDIRASGLSIPANLMLHNPNWQCSRHASHLFGFAFACRHLITGIGHGFHADPGDAEEAEEERPPAWCDECQAQHLRTGEHHTMRVCAACYDEAKSKMLIR